MRPAIPLLLLLATAACAAHPEGEREERDRAVELGRDIVEDDPPPPLPADPSPDDYLRLAFFANADLRARYFEWRAAIERVPQESSPPDLALSFGYLFGGDNMKAWDRTTLGIQNMPTEMIPPPSKLAAKGQAALEEARAKGLRFEAAKFRLQAEVLSAYQDLALHGEWIRIQEERVALAELVLGDASARVESGTAEQTELVAAQNELDLSRNELANLHAQMPPLVARVNALLGREHDAVVPLPARQPDPRPLPAEDAQILALAAERSPELSALEREASARQSGLDLAELARVPDFALGFSVTGSVSSMLSGMISLPVRGEAIDAGIAEARALLRAARETRAQYQRDLAASFVLDLYVLRNAERQIDLFSGTIVPRTQASAELAAAAWESGRGDLPGMVEARRMLLDARLALAQLRAEREKALAAIETWSKLDVETLHPVRIGGRGM